MSNVPLENLWKSGGPALDVDVLARRAAASHTRQKRLLVFEGVSTAIVVVFWGAMLLIKSTPAVIAAAIASYVALALWWWILLKNQRGTWESSSMTAIEFVALERQRLKAAARHAQVTTVAVCILCALLMAAMPLLWRASPIYQQEPWRLGIAAFILCGVVAVTLVQAALRSRRHEKLRLELEELDGLDRE